MTSNQLLKMAVLKQQSDLGFCAIEAHVYKIETLKSYKKRFIETHNLFIIEKTERVYTPVILSKTSKEVFWMDCITGTFFTKEGRSDSSLKLDIKSLVLNQEQGAKFLSARNTYRSRVYDKLGG